MGRNFRNDIALFQALHRHFLFDCSDVLRQPERSNNIGPDRPKSVLAVCEMLFPPQVDADQYQVTPDHSQQLLYVAMKFVAATSSARADYEVSFPLLNRLDEPRDVSRVVRPVGVHEHYNWMACRRGADANGVSLPFLVIADHLDPITARHFPGAVRRVSVNNQNFLAVIQSLLNDFSDILFFVPGRDNNRNASRELSDHVVCRDITMLFGALIH